MEKRPLRFSLHETFFEGSRSGGREDCLSTCRSIGEGAEWSQHKKQVEIYYAESRTAEKIVSGTALGT